MAETLGQFQGRISKYPVGAGVDAEVLLGIINDRIEEICRSRPWTRLEKQSVLQTVAAYTTGTVTIDAGATSGTGDGTTFTSAMTGRLIRFNNLLEIYEFTYVGAGAFTIDRALEGDDDLEDVTFRIWQPVYELPSDLAEIKSLRNPTIGIDLEQFDREWLDRNATTRMNYGPPRLYVPAEDSANELPQIELYPGPEDAVGLPMRYRAQPPLFADVADTSVEFPDWFSIPAMTAGVLADLYELTGDPNTAQLWESKFQRRVMEMANEDARRMPPTVMGQADRYTAHRAARATRGGVTSRNWNGTE